MTEEEDERAAQGRANWWLPRLTAFQSHDAFVPLGCHSTFVPLLPEHICATARQRASLGLPHNAPQWRRVSGGPPLSGRGGSGKQGTEVAQGL